MSSQPDDILAISALHAGYGRYDVVRDIDLTVGRGEAVALLGPNGAGKSTVLRAIMGLLRHRRGSIRVNGTELISMPAHKVARGYAALVPEGRRLFLNLSVADNLLLGGMRHRRDAEQTAQLLSSVYELFPVLSDYRDRPAVALSGGEQQMVAIGRMMMSDPAVMLLDEPSLGLAPIAVEAVVEALLELRRRGSSLLVVEQRVDLATRLCGRLYVLTGGQIVTQAQSDDLDVSSRDLIAAYLG